MKKPLAIGVDNYKKIIDEGYYYVDKTLLIKEILDKKGEVNLFTRPRRFGKTLALSMIQTYFEKEYTRNGELLDNREYFAGKKIMKAGEQYTSELGQYPVISLSLKSAKQPSYEMAYASLVNTIWKEYDRHSYVLLNDSLSEAEEERFRSILNMEAKLIDYATALEFLSVCLEKYHHQKVIILIDEYDVPLENAYFRGFYVQMIDFVRSLFESALKTNNSLWFAVITGCLRISKESIFTGLNNLQIISILNKDYAEYFGFVQTEIDDMLTYYEITGKTDEAEIETEIRNVLKSSISYYDGNESFYHGIMTGLLQGWSDYTIKSNRESGNGRPDLVLIPLDEREPLYILEFKYTKVFTKMDGACLTALQQIEEQNYAEEFLNEGYQNIKKFAICFCKKSCRVIRSS